MIEAFVKPPLDSTKLIRFKYVVRAMHQIDSKCRNRHPVDEPTFERQFGEKKGRNTMSQR